MSSKKTAVIWRAEIALIENGIFLYFRTLSQLVELHEHNSSVSRRWPADSTGFCCLAREKTSGRGSNTCLWKALWAQQCTWAQYTQFITNLQNGRKSKSKSTSKILQPLTIWKLLISNYHFHTNISPKSNNLNTNEENKSQSSGDCLTLAWREKLDKEVTLLGSAYTGF